MVDATKTSSDKAENDSGNVQVVVRVRPLISIESGSESCINVLPPSDPCNAEYCDEEEKETSCKTLQIKGHDFNFDKIMQQETSQITCYE